MAFLLAIFGVVSLIVLSSAIGAIWGGFVLMKLWLWFIVPVFHLPVLTLVPAIGMCFVVSYMTHQYQYTDDDEDKGKRAVGVLSYGLIYPAIVLFMGWILQMFM